MAAYDRVNLFKSGESTRGLSGAGSQGIALDDANSAYNFLLVRHYTDDDMIERPDRLWYTNDDPSARTGLGPHIAAALTEERHFTDVLVILSRDDWENGERSGGDFIGAITAELRAQFAEFVKRTALVPSERPLGVWLVVEGSEAINGLDFGLVEGEFVTGIVPNVYRGPAPSSRPILALHANIPGMWEGYREIVRLYDDQHSVSIGAHWLDNFSHPALRESAIYRVKRVDGGSFFHMLNPDVSGAYALRSVDQNGTTITTVTTKAGEPVIHLVLAVIEEQEEAVAEAAAVESAAEASPPMLTSEGVVNLDAAPRARGSKTIMPEAQDARIFTFQERGALLQKVHFGAVMLGYDVFIGRRGEVSTFMDDPAARVEVRKKSVSIVAHVAGVSVDGQPLAAGDSRLIEADAVLEVGKERLEYRDLRHIEVEGWPYLGEIRRPASSIHMLWGRDYLIGRSRESQVVLPDEPRNDNIVWKPGVEDGDMIHTKNGDIPKARFYTDSIMVASEHAALELGEDDAPQLVCRASNSFAFVRRAGEVIALHPTRDVGSPHAEALRPGDEVLVGNSLFYCSFASDDEAPALAETPSAESLGVSLSDAAGAPAFDVRADDDGIEEMPPEAFEALDAPAPGGLAPGGLFANLPETLEEEAPLPPPRVDEAARASLSAAGSRSMPPQDPDEPAPPRGLAPHAEVEVPELPEEPTLAPPDAAPMLDLDAPAVVEVEQAPAVAEVEEAPAIADVESAPAVAEVEEAPEDAAAAPAPEPVVAVDDAVAETDAADVSAPADAPVEPRTAESPAVEPLPVEPPPGESSPSVAEGDVLWVDDQAAGVALGRPARLTLVGWSVQGSATLGNHAGADLVLPENRIEAEQVFEARDYFTLRVRGKRASAFELHPTEVRVGGEAPSGDLDSLDGITLEVIRRDEEGEEDFAVSLRLESDASLPDPRARLLRILDDEDMADALRVVGLPLKVGEAVQLQGIQATATFDGTTVTLADYLDSYRDGEDYKPFFVGLGDQRFRTAPEDGEAIVLSAGDRLVVGAAVYRVDLLD